MEKALSAQHSNAANSLLAAILCGGLSASGGGIMGKLYCIYVYNIYRASSSLV
jgi:hypothetical protein